MAPAQQSRVLRCYSCHIFQAHQVGWASASPSFLAGWWARYGGPPHMAMGSVSDEAEGSAALLSPQDMPLAISFVFICCCC